MFEFLIKLQFFKYSTEMNCLKVKTNPCNETLMSIVLLYTHFSVPVKVFPQESR
jgi:hypothetical protein